jgi:hypothetical protein
MIQFPDGSIIGQKRNNVQVLTQYTGLTSSASGAVSIMDNNTGAELLRANAAAEVIEELGVDTRSLSKFPDITNLTESIQVHILRELGIANI